MCFFEGSTTSSPRAPAGSLLHVLAAVVPASFLSCIHSCVQQLLWRLTTLEGSWGWPGQVSSVFLPLWSTWNPFTSSSEKLFLVLILFSLGADLLLLSHIERRCSVFFISGYQSCLSLPLVSESHPSSLATTIQLRFFSFFLELSLRERASVLKVLFLLFVCDHLFHISYSLGIVTLLSASIIYQVVV